MTSRLGELHGKRPNITGVISLWRDPLGASDLGEFGRAWVSVGAFQLSLFSFVYSLFSLSSLVFPRILRLIQIWE